LTFADHVAGAAKKVEGRLARGRMREQAFDTQRGGGRTHRRGHGGGRVAQEPVDAPDKRSFAELARYSGSIAGLGETQTPVGYCKWSPQARAPVQRPRRLIPIRN
jgi:hypothetical protein